MKEKIQVDFNLQKTQAAFTNAKQRSRSEHRFVDPATYKSYEIKIAELKKQSQELQSEISKINHALKHGDAKTLGEIFIEVARLRLPTEVFDKLLREALTIRSGEL